MRLPERFGEERQPQRDSPSASAYPETSRGTGVPGRLVRTALARSTPVIPGITWSVTRPSMCNSPSRMSQGFFGGSRLDHFVSELDQHVRGVHGAHQRFVVDQKNSRPIALTSAATASPAPPSRPFPR